MGLTPDSSTVVFEGNTNGEHKPRLYSVPISGGEIKIFADFSIYDFEITRDSSRVVFISRGHLYSAPIRSDDAVLLSGQGEYADFSPIEFLPSRDNARVVFLGRNHAGTARLFSIPIDGGEIIPLSHDTHADRELEIDDFSISNDSTTVVFLGDTEIDLINRVYSVPIEGGDITALSQNTTDDDILQVSNFTITETNRVLYLANRKIGATNMNLILYSVPIGGGEATPLSPNGDEM